MVGEFYCLVGRGWVCVVCFIVWWGVVGCVWCVGWGVFGVLVGCVWCVWWGVFGVFGVRSVLGVLGVFDVLGLLGGTGVGGHCGHPRRGILPPRYQAPQCPPAGDGRCAWCLSAS